MGSRRKKNKAKHSIKAVTVKKDELRKSNPFMIDLTVYEKFSRTGPRELCMSGGPNTLFTPENSQPSSK